MTCDACGEKPKNTAKDFTKAVIEINNPETLVLLRKVVIPASMGTEEDVPAAIGKYHNVILYYEANKHTYLYSSDGIPTLIEMDVPKELLDRIDTLEEGLEQEITVREGMDEVLQDNIDAVAQDLEDFKNSPDVVDIVPTYAALQAYDTSSLGNNDEIRVLTDETHDDASAYYRWDKTNGQWIFIGITGPYYTKNEIDTTVQNIENRIGQAKVLTEDDYNWNSQTKTAVEPFDSVALWLLESGTYSVPADITAYSHLNVSTPQAFSNGIVLVSSDETYSGRNVVSMISLHYSLVYPTHSSGQTFTPYMYSIDKASGQGTFTTLLASSSVRNNLTSNSTSVPLSAEQGRILNERIGDLSTLTTTDKTSAVAAINELSAKTGISVLESGDNLWELDPGMYLQPESTLVNVTTTIPISTLSTGNIIYIISGKIGGYRFIWRFDWNGVSGGSGYASGGVVYATDANGVILTTPKYPQNVACFDSLFDDPEIKKKVKIGNSTDIDSNITSAIAIGYYAKARGERSVAIGPSEDNNNPTTANGADSISIGSTAKSYGGGVSIGYQAGHSSNSSSNRRVNLGYQAGMNGRYADGVSIGSYSNGAGERAIALGNYSTATGSGAIAIGGSVNSSSATSASGIYSVSIGIATADGERSVAIGNGSRVTAGTRAIAIGGGIAGAQGAVAIGAGSQTGTQGVFDIGDTTHPNGLNYGYNNSDYRLLTGLYDPQSAHDAATKGYVDAAIAGAGVVTINSTDWSNLWQ